MTDEVGTDRELRIRRALQHLRNNTTDQVAAPTTFVAAEHTDVCHVWRVPVREQPPPVG